MNVERFPNEGIMNNNIWEHRLSRHSEFHCSSSTIAVQVHYYWNLLLAYFTGRIN